MWRVVEEKKDRLESGEVDVVIKFACRKSKMTGEHWGHASLLLRSPPTGTQQHGQEPGVWPVPKAPQYGTAASGCDQACGVGGYAQRSP